LIEFALHVLPLPEPELLTHIQPEFIKPAAHADPLVQTTSQVHPHETHVQDRALNQILQLLRQMPH